MLGDKGIMSFPGSKLQLCIIFVDALNFDDGNETLGIKNIVAILVICCQKTSKEVAADLLNIGIIWVVVHCNNDKDNASFIDSRLGPNGVIPKQCTECITSL